jgi:serine/threonine protein kinase
MFTQKKHRNALPTEYQLQEYLIQSVLGNGGFGITYLAQDTLLDAPVAIKEYLPNELAVRDTDFKVQPKSQRDTEDFTWGLERFLDEARTLAQFKHPNIVRILRFFRANDTAYIVMDYEQGQSLAAAFKKGKKIPETELMELLLPLLEALEIVHNAGYLHRDIKPDNIYLREKDNSPVLLDFGAARYIIGNHSRLLTTMMTPGYTPFEQYAYDSHHGNWSDIYSLAAVLYRLISGKTPIDAIQRIDALRRNKPDPLEPAVKIGRGQYSKKLLQAIDWSLEINEGTRPQNVGAWRDQLFLSKTQPITASRKWTFFSFAKKKPKIKELKASPLPSKKMARLKSQKTFPTLSRQKMKSGFFTSQGQSVRLSKTGYGLILFIGLIVGYGLLEFWQKFNFTSLYETPQKIIQWFIPQEAKKKDDNLNALQLETPFKLIELTQREAALIGQQIWINESLGKISGLISWNEQDHFASVGIIHLSWYPKGSLEQLPGTLPDFLDFLQEQGVSIPKWLTSAQYCPWKTRQEFILHQRHYQMNNLRQLMKNTIPQQVQFMVKRLEQTVPKMLENFNTEKQREHVRKQLERVAQTQKGIYALIDYVNLSGEGLNIEEGQDWGLLQVLEQMPEHFVAANATQEFADAATIILTRHIKNAPENDELRLVNWETRIATYR